MMKILQIASLLLILAGASFSQNKIGFVDDYQFYDEKTGIRKLVETIKLTYDCEFITPQITKRMGELKLEIENLKKSGKSTESQTSELAELKEQLNKINDSKKRRYASLVEPIEKKIKEKLQLFANKNSYTKIVNFSDYENSILYVNDSIDVTKDFIKFCNEEFEKENLLKINHSSTKLKT